MSEGGLADIPGVESVRRLQVKPGLVLVLRMMPGCCMGSEERAFVVGQVKGVLSRVEGGQDVQVMILPHGLGLEVAEIGEQR